jgi:ketosteroid isomerase-like protein
MVVIKTRALLFVAMLGMAVAASPGRIQSQAEPHPQASTIEPGSPKAERVAIRTVLAAQVAEWNRGDIDAFMDGYWNSPDTEFVGSNGIVRGYQTVLARYHKQYPDRAAMGQLTFSELEVNLLGPNAALVVGHWQLKRQNDAPGGVFTLVFKKFPDGWVIINDHTSQTSTP